MLVCGAREGTDWCHFAPAGPVTQGDCANSTFCPRSDADERAGLVALDPLHQISRQSYTMQQVCPVRVWEQYPSPRWI